MPRADLTVSDRLASFGIKHHPDPRGDGRRYLTHKGAPLGLMDTREAINLLDLLEPGSFREMLSGANRDRYAVEFGGPAISRDMAFLQERLGRDAEGVVRYCVSCMSSQLGADEAGEK